VTGLRYRCQTFASLCSLTNTILTCKPTLLGLYSHTSIAIHAAVASRCCPCIRRIITWTLTHTRARSRDCITLFIPSRVRRISCSSRRLDHGLVLLATGSRRGLTLVEKPQSRPHATWSRASAKRTKEPLSSTFRGSKSLACKSRRTWPSSSACRCLELMPVTTHHSCHMCTMC
jgi:hypothetical protein